MQVASRSPRRADLPSATRFGGIGAVVVLLALDALVAVADRIRRGTLSVRGALDALALALAEWSRRARAVGVAEALDALGPGDVAAPLRSGALRIRATAAPALEVTVADRFGGRAIGVAEALDAFALAGEALRLARRTLGVLRTLDALRCQRIADCLAPVLAVRARLAAEALTGGCIADGCITRTIARVFARRMTLVVFRPARWGARSAVGVGSTLHAVALNAQPRGRAALRVGDALDATECRVTLPAVSTAVGVATADGAAGAVPGRRAVGGIAVGTARDHDTNASEDERED